jgi:predicted O-methyltransferase YrrM
VNQARARHILEYPLNLAGAVAAARRLRRHQHQSPEEALAFARSFRWYRGGNISPTQQDEEILGLMRELAKRPPRTVVEIGTDTGGTLFLFSRVAAPDAVLVTVDQQPLGALRNYSAWAIVRRAFACDRQRVDLLIPRDSHDPTTVDEIRWRLGGRSVDFLFIDGDHEYDGVKRDFELYAPLVGPGGLIAFHDVNESNWPGVIRLWNEIKPDHETHEFVANDPPGRYGIGVIAVRAAIA